MGTYRPVTYLVWVPFAGVHCTPSHASPHGSVPFQFTRPAGAPADALMIIRALAAGAEGVNEARL